MTFTWIPQRAIIEPHRILIAAYGGLEGPCNSKRLESTLYRPQHKLAYEKPDLADLAAAYGYGLANSHCFPDGNKRISLAAIDMFLQINGYKLMAAEADAVVTVRAVAAGETQEAERAEWIRHNIVGLQPIPPARRP